MTNRDLNELLNKYLNGTISDDELRLLIYYFEEVSRAPEKSGSTLTTEQLQAAKELGFAHLRNKIADSNSVSGRFGRYKPLKVAIAAFVLIIPLWTYLAMLKPSAKTDEVILHAGAGEVRKIILPDSTTVFLNSESQLSYPPAFHSEERKVKLVGEAYFDVAKNKKWPFVVETTFMDIKVLGTTFNVKSYDEDGYGEASLFTGEVMLFPKTQHTDTSIQDSISLHPQQKYTVTLIDKQTDRETNTANPNGGINRMARANLTSIDPKDPDSTISEIDWIHGRMVFHNESLVDIARRISRVNGISIDVLHPEKTVARYSGTFSAADSPRHILNALRIIHPFEIKEELDKITIY